MVPAPSASGTLRPGSRISSATYEAAFHPAYANITGTSASSHDEAATGPAGSWRFAADPVPTVSPSAMKSTKIGRASCRERGEMSVGAGAEKKKREERKRY